MLAVRRWLTIKGCVAGMTLPVAVSSLFFCAQKGTQMAGMKSAVELAMEKLKQQETTVAGEPLTDAKRQEISALRKQYEAKIAEKEIMLQAEIRQLVQRRPPQEAMAAAQELQAQFQQTRQALQEELETKLAAVRAARS